MNFPTNLEEFTSAVEELIEAEKFLQFPARELREVLVELAEALERAFLVGEKLSSTQTLLLKMFVAAIEDECESVTGS